MLFNSLTYILLFLPISIFIYFFISKNNQFGGKIWLFSASLFFYGYWNPPYILLILLSIIVNFYIGKLLQEKPTKMALIAGISINIGLLAYYKYTNFFITNINQISEANFEVLNIVLPLGISFITFQKIAYLVDSYKGLCKEKQFIDFCLFATFFPQLISGPIVHHGEMMPQFSKKNNKEANWNHLNTGMLIFSIGLFKKIILADTLAIWVNANFDTDVSLSFLAAWATSISYTLQIYFDFSGYTDMAIGSAIMMNIRLPQNFNSPYRATNIKEFWSCWHMTLSRWLRDYLYIPLGGNRHGLPRAYGSLLITFLLGGLWHGASWTFVIWGALHGFAAITHKAWSMLGVKLHRFLAWPLTFLFITTAWVFFRAKDMPHARRIFNGMTDISSIPDINDAAKIIFNTYEPTSATNMLFPNGTPSIYLNAAYITIGFIICMFPINSSKLISDKAIATLKHQKILTIFLFSYSLFFIVYCHSRISPFIYFNF